MTGKLIIAVCGLAGSGKDTACDYLVKDHHYKKTSFAAPLKQMAKIAFGFTDEQLYGPSTKREEQDVRYPFSGNCVACGGDCRHVTGDLHVADHWSCTKCFRGYPEFINARIALQTLGTEWGRRLTPNIWADAAVNNILNSEEPRWCLSDLRFKNEFDAVKAAGGFVIRLMRGKVQHHHASETELLSIPLSDFDMVLHNHGGLDQLYIGLASAAREFYIAKNHGTQK